MHHQRAGGDMMSDMVDSTQAGDFLMNSLVLIFMLCFPWTWSRTGVLFVTTVPRFWCEHEYNDNQSRQNTIFTYLDIISIINSKTVVLSQKSDIQGSKYCCFTNFQIT